MEADGFEVWAFADPDATLRSHDRISLEADCLILDYRLPKMDGLMLTRVLRDRGLAAPAILITTEPDERCRAAARDLGVVIVEKPLTTEALAESVARALHGGVGGP